MPEQVCSRCGYFPDGSAYGCDCDPPIVLVPRPPSRLESAKTRVALLEGLLRDLVAKGEAMKAALFTGDDNREAIACMEWDDAVRVALADGGDHA